MFIILLCWLSTLTGCQQTTKTEEDEPMRMIFRTTIPCILPNIKADNQELLFVDPSAKYMGVVYPYQSPEGLNTDGMSLNANALLVGYQIQFFGARGLRQASGSIIPSDNELTAMFGRYSQQGPTGNIFLPWIDEDFHNVENLLEVQGVAIEYRPQVTAGRFLVDTRQMDDEFLGASCSMVVSLTVDATYGAE